MEEQSRAELGKLEQACISKSHELREVEEQLERMRYSLQCMEADVQAAEDRCSQLQQLCADLLPITLPLRSHASAILPPTVTPTHSKFAFLRLTSKLRSPPARPKLRH